MPAMTSARFDVLGIGNAIVDVLARADDDFLLAHAMREQKVIVGPGKDIDDGVADAEDVETSGGHGWH